MIDQFTTINCKGKLLSLEKPIVMGIINITPDSFYDGGRYSNVDQVLRQAEKMVTEGASIMDIGGMSSRPGAAIIEEEEELSRVIEVIRRVHEIFPEVILSIDTFRSKVAEEAIEAGASIVNDISAGKLDQNMYATVGKLSVPYILMHMQNLPESMQKNPNYEDVTQEVLDFFIFEINRLQELGVLDIIVDPGFGFGKSLKHNYELLNKLHVFKLLSFPVLAGISRKSMIYKVLNTKPEQALNGTTALHMVALQQGAKILRVHDVKPAIETIALFTELTNAIS